MLIQSATERAALRARRRPGAATPSRRQREQRVAVSIVTLDGWLLLAGADQPASAGTILSPITTPDDSLIRISASRPRHHDNRSHPLPVLDVANRADNCERVCSARARDDNDNENDADAGDKTMMMMMERLWVAMRTNPLGASDGDAAAAASKTRRRR
jgi:hypothetical protein